ncbi:MAG: SWIM zinc finger family protein [Chthoniobacteraceae bacterium]
MSWYEYEYARDRKAELRRQVERRRKAGESFEVLTAPQRGKLTTTFWGKAWGDHLEMHRDYENRLPRGRSYLRQGNVYNLVIEPGVVTAVVAGSEFYDVTVRITPLSRPAWKCLKEDCAGQVNSLLDLLGGKLGEGVLRAVTDPDRGLFPKPKEIRFSCSCPDYADMCKHVAAVLYGVGVKLDTQPDLFFLLRSVDPSELLSIAANDALAPAMNADAALAGEDLSALFGIDLGDAPLDLPPQMTKTRTPRKTRIQKSGAQKADAPRKGRSAL